MINESRAGSFFQLDRFIVTFKGLRRDWASTITGLVFCVHRVTFPSTMTKINWYFTFELDCNNTFFKFSPPARLLHLWSITFEINEKHDWHSFWTFVFSQWPAVYGTSSAKCSTTYKIKYKKGNKLFFLQLSGKDVLLV